MSCTRYTEYVDQLTDMLFYNRKVRSNLDEIKKYIKKGADPTGIRNNASLIRLHARESNIQLVIFYGQYLSDLPEQNIHHFLIDRFNNLQDNKQIDNLVNSVIIKKLLPKDRIIDVISTILDAARRRYKAESTKSSFKFLTDSENKFIDEFLSSYVLNKNDVITLTDKITSLFLLCHIKHIDRYDLYNLLAKSIRLTKLEPAGVVELLNTIHKNNLKLNKSSISSLVHPKLDTIQEVFYCHEAGKLLRDLIDHNDTTSKHLLEIITKLLDHCRFNDYIAGDLISLSIKKPQLNISLVNKLLELYQLDDTEKNSFLFQILKKHYNNNKNSNDFINFIKNMLQSCNNINHGVTSEVWCKVRTRRWHDMPDTEYIRYSYNETLLHLAMRMKMYKIIPLLISHNADTNAMNSEADEILHRRFPEQENGNKPPHQLDCEEFCPQTPFQLANSFDANKSIDIYLETMQQILMRSVTAVIIQGQNWNKSHFYVLPNEIASHILGHVFGCKITLDETHHKLTQLGYFDREHNPQSKSIFSKIQSFFKPKNSTRKKAKKDSSNSPAPQ